jgi:multidrug efflux pump subunit AcrB
MVNRTTSAAGGFRQGATASNTAATDTAAAAIQPAHPRLDLILLGIWAMVLSGMAPFGNLVVGWSDDRPLYLRDVADVRTEHVEANWFSYRSGVPAYYITLQRTSDSNTVELVDGVKQAIAELNAGPLAKEKLFVELSWDGGTSWSAMTGVRRRPP